LRVGIEDPPVKPDYQELALIANDAWKRANFNRMGEVGGGFIFAVDLTTL